MAKHTVELQQMMNMLNAIPFGERNVDRWNKERELVFKPKYSEQSIGILDGSGFISKWLREAYLSKVTPNVHNDVKDEA